MIAMLLAVILKLGMPKTSKDDGEVVEPEDAEKEKRKIMSEMGKRGG